MLRVTNRHQPSPCEGVQQRPRHEHCLPSPRNLKKHTHDQQNDRLVCPPMQQKSSTKVSHLAVCLWFLTFSRTLSESPATYVKLVDLEPFQSSMWCTNTVQLRKSTFCQSFPCRTAGTSHSQILGEHYFLGKSVNNICEKFHHPSLNTWFRPPASQAKP